MMRAGVRKYGRGRKPKKAKIDFSALPSLSSEILKPLECVFVVDLTSFGGKSCNRLLHQMLFGKVMLEYQDKVKIYVIMKTKFSPMCKECGIGEKGSKLFIKDRFIHSGDGRVLLGLTPADSSLDYRKQLSKYVYEHNQNLVILSEDKEYGYKIIGSSVPDDDPESLDFLKYFDMSHLFDHDNEYNNRNEEIQEEQTLVTDKVVKKVDKWIEKRVENESDVINLPKTVKSLEKTLEVFCKSSLPFPFKQIFTILKDCGDITICHTCQTCKPVSTNTSNQFYFSYKTLDEETSKQCNWMMLHIISEYCKNTTNQVPLKLTNLTKSTSAPTRSFKISAQTIISHLINESQILKIEDKKPYISTFSLQFNDQLSLNDNNNNNNSNSSFSTPKKSYSTNTTPLKSKLSTLTPKKTFGTPLTSKFKPTTSSKPTFSSNSFSSESFDPSDKLVWLNKEERFKMALDLF